MHRKKYTCQIIILISGCLVFHLCSTAQTPADSLLNFILKNKNKSSLYLSVNDSTIAKLNENKPMPLAQTVNIMIAIEFAKQTGSGVIDEDEYIPLSEIDKYYLPDVDSANQQNWLNYELSQQHILNDSIQLINIARGMIIYDCNANAEYLLDLLGFDNVKNNAQLFNLKYHTAIFPIVASMFLYQNPRRENTNEILSDIKHLSEENYCRAIFGVHQALKNDTTLKPKFRIEDFSAKMHREWSNRLTSSTTKEYVTICKTLNKRRLFSDLSYGIIAETLESAMENPINMQLFRHLGIKSGSTPWLLTNAVYATGSDGKKIEMAFFFNDISPMENARLKKWATDFEMQALTNEKFRQKLSSLLY